MEPLEVAQNYIEAFNARDFDAAGSYLADNFLFSGPVPEPVGGAQYMGLSRIIYAAFPDIDYGIHIVGAEGNVVQVNYTLSGTHTGDFDLTAMGLGVIPATGRSFSNKREIVNYTIEGDQIVSIHTDPVDGAGMPAILAQIGYAPG